MRRSLLALVVLFSLLPSVVFSQEPGYAYTKPALDIFISGGDQKFQSQLRDKLSILLHTKYTVRFVDAHPSERGAVVTYLSADRENSASNLNPVKYTIKARVKITGVSKLIENTITANESGKDADQVYNAAILKIAGEIYDACMLSFPITANIRSREKDKVFIDRSPQTGFSAGVFCDVYDEDNEHVGIVKIIEADENQAIGKIIRGKNTIEAGNSIRRRHFVERFGVSIETFYLPASSSMGTVYTQVTGDSTSGPQLEKAFVAAASLIFDFSAGGSQAGIGGGVMNCGDYNFWLLQAYVAPAVSVIYDRLSLSAKLGGGLFMVNGQPYARPPGTYDDGLPDQGNTDFNAHWYLSVEPGIRFYLTRSASISLFGGYFYSGKGDDWSKSVGEGKESESKDLKSEWARYDHIQISGFSFGILLSFSGTVW